MEYKNDDCIELFIEFTSKTDPDIYNIKCKNGSCHTTQSYTWEAPQNAPNQTQSVMLNYQEQVNFEAFRLVHWARNAYLYFDEQDVVMKNGLKIKIDKNHTWNYPPISWPEIHFELHKGDDENTMYHEIGHALMFSIVDHFVYPCYEEIGHSGNDENTYKAAFYEGWATFIQGVLDAQYCNEDDEYACGYLNGNTPDMETSDMLNYQNNGINNGLRSESLIAIALYDLWDGPASLAHYSGSSLPGNEDWHPWNDVCSDSHEEIIWDISDDVEIPFSLLCEAVSMMGILLDDNKFTIARYYDLLITLLRVNEYSEYEIAKIPRAFQENFIVFDIDANQNRRNHLGMDSDISLFESMDFTESVLQCLYLDVVLVIDRINSNNSNNTYDLNADGSSRTFTDPIWIGSPFFEEETVLSLNNGNFQTLYYNDIAVQNGILNIGSNSELIINDLVYSELILITI